MQMSVDSRWILCAGGPGFDMPLAIAVEGDGSLLVTGEFGMGTAGSSATFGPGEPGQVVLSSTGAEIFVARYAGDDGRLLAAKSAGGSGNDTGQAIHATPGGFVVVGDFGGQPGTQATFGAGQPGETTLTARDGGAVFVALYATDGKLTWAQSGVSENALITARAVTVAVNGDLIAGGGFSIRATFNLTSLGPAKGGVDGFLVIYRP